MSTSRVSPSLRSYLMSSSSRWGAARGASASARPTTTAGTSRVLTHVRGAHKWGYGADAPPHTNTDHLPFNYLNKRAFTIKFIAYLGVGFALPWVAIWWIWHRPNGFKNPTDKIDWSIRIGRQRDINRPHVSSS
ncbi:hypothetical protein D9758_008785 [Tetrapyrgos nigripes]|uniref:Uncharacterized protein n=1 Tax=Tetrapyrgos nigripes TaxID=182062 RepID=A0A8H5FY01_9AGAR|nr:hypothetical protein D9758_008785 [Tetrapyrgos nigripes]